jgi:hypothetical protein
MPIFRDYCVSPGVLCAAKNLAQNGVIVYFRVNAVLGACVTISINLQGFIDWNRSTLAWRIDVTDRNSNASKASVRRTYARPALTVYGSVRELTGGMSSSGSDAMLMLNMMGV